MNTNKFGVACSLRALVGAALLGLAAGAAHATAVVEAGDAGQSLGGAQVTAGSAAINTFSGTLLTTSGSDYADLFRIYLSAGSTFSATTTASAWNVNNFDTSLFLFDSTGHGVVANDDDPAVGPTSTISSSVSTSGFYYLAIAGAGYTPVSAGGSIFGSLVGANQVFATGPGGSGALSGWQSVTSDGDSYEIVMQGAYAGVVSSVPEPEPALMLLGGLGALGLAARRRRRLAAQAAA